MGNQPVPGLSQNVLLYDCVQIDNVNLCVYENILMGWRFYQYYKDVTYRAVLQSENLLLKQKRCSPRRGIEPRPPA